MLAGTTKMLRAKTGVTRACTDKQALPMQDKATSALPPKSDIDALFGSSETGQ